MESKMNFADRQIIKLAEAMARVRVYWYERKDSYVFAIPYDDQDTPETLNAKIEAIRGKAGDDRVLNVSDNPETRLINFEITYSDPGHACQEMEEVRPELSVGRVCRAGNKTYRFLYVSRDDSETIRLFTGGGYFVKENDGTHSFVFINRKSVIAVAPEGSMIVAENGGYTVYPFEEFYRSFTE